MNDGGQFVFAGASYGVVWLGTTDGAPGSGRSEWLCLPLHLDCRGSFTKFEGIGPLIGLA